MRDVGFKIKPVVEGAQAKQQLTGIGKLLHEQKSLTEKLKHTEAARVQASGSQSAKLKLHLSEVTEKINQQREAAEKLGEKFKQASSAFGSVSGSLGGSFGIMSGIASGGMSSAIEGGIQLFEKGVEFVKEAGKFAAEKAVELYREGKKDVELKERFEREFGVKRTEQMMRAADLIGGRAGIENNEAAQGLLRLREAMPDISEGMRVTASLAKRLGMGNRRTLSGEDAENLENQMLAKRGSLFARLSILHPDLDKDMLARAIGDAGSGAGSRALVNQLGLGKQASKFLMANEAGQIGKKDLAKFGLTKDDLKGLQLENGRLRTFDALEVVLKKFGQTEEAADAHRGKFDFQVQAIKATLGDVFSEIGADIYTSFNGPLEKGVTLADKFRQYVASPDGKAAIKSVAEALADVAGWIGGLIQTVPQMFHNMKHMAHEAEVALRPLRMGLMAMQGASTAEIARFVATNNVSDKLYEREDFVHHAKIKLAEDRKRREAETKAGQKEGGSGSSSSSPQVINVHHSINMDGHQIGKHVVRHVVDGVRRSSAGGVAPHSAGT